MGTGKDATNLGYLGDLGDDAGNSSYTFWILGVIHNSPVYFWLNWLFTRIFITNSGGALAIIPNSCSTKRQP